MTSGALVISEAGTEDLSAVAGLCGRAFVNPDAAWFARTMATDPEAGEAITLLGHLGGELACTLRVFARQVRWRGRWLRLGGIGNVATAPEHQGKGLANTLMHAAAEHMERRGFEISLLFTDKPRVYEKSGYVLTRQPWFRASLASARGAAGDVTPRRLQAEDVPRLLPLLDAMNEGHTGPARRTAAHWACVSGLYPKDDTLSLVAERASRPVAHVRAMPCGEQSLRVHELVAGDSAAGGALLATLAEQARQMGHEEVVLTLPDWPVIRESIDRVFGSWRVSSEPAAMWRTLGAGPSAAEIASQAEAGELYYWAGDRF